MSLALGSINSALTNLRASGATRINSLGNMVGIDFATTAAAAASTGSKTYSVGQNRDWVVGMPLIVTASDDTANISMTGTVTSYDNTSGNLVVNITATGSDTTTTKTSWRIGHTGPRLDHDFDSPFARIGMRSEEQHTNSLRNGDAVGATTGTLGGVGVLPTNWSFPTTGGLSLDITAGVNERGVSGVYLRFYGTTTGTSAVLRFESPTHITYAPGAMWASSFYSRLSAGNLTNITSVNNAIEESTSGGSLANTTLTAISPTAVLQRFVRVLIAENTTASRINNGLQLVFNSGVDIDATFFVGACQMGLMRSQSNSGTAQAGGASTITLATGASSTNNFYNNMKIVIRAGTGAGQTNNVTGYAGSTRVATVSTPWDVVPDSTSTYSVFRTETISNDTYSYCPTRTQSAVKSADNFLAANFASFFTGLSASEGTIYAEGTTAPWLDSTATASPRLWSLNAMTTQTDTRLYRSTVTSEITGQTLVANVGQTSFHDGIAIADKTSFKVSMSYKHNLYKWCYNGGTVSTDTNASVPTEVAQLVVGSSLHSATTSGTWNGWVRSLRFFPRALTDSEHLLLASGGL